MDRGDDLPEFPDVPMRAYLVEWLLDLGCVQQGGMSTSGLSHSEIRAWADNIGMKFRDNDAHILHRMSDAYAAELTASDDKDRAAPYIG